MNKSSIAGPLATLAFGVLFVVTASGDADTAHGGATSPPSPALSAAALGASLQIPPAQAPHVVKAQRLLRTGVANADAPRQAPHPLSQPPPPLQFMTMDEKAAYLSAVVGQVFTASTLFDDLILNDRHTFEEHGALLCNQVSFGSPWTNKSDPRFGAIHGIRLYGDPAPKPVPGQSGCSIAFEQWAGVKPYLVTIHGESERSNLSLIVTSGISGDQVTAPLNNGPNTVLFAVQPVDRPRVSQSVDLSVTGPAVLPGEGFLIRLIEVTAVH